MLYYKRASISDNYAVYVSEPLVGTKMSMCILHTLMISVHVNSSPEAAKESQLIKWRCTDQTLVVNL